MSGKNQNDDKRYGANRFRRALVHFIGGRVVQAVSRALLILLVVRVLQVEDYGAYMLIVGVAEMLPLIASLGTISVVQRYVPQVAERSDRRTLVRFIVSVSGIQMSLMLLVSLAIWVYWPSLAGWVKFSEAQIQATRLTAALCFLIPTRRFLEEIMDALLEQGKSQISRAMMPLGRVVVLGSVLAFDMPIDLAFIMAVEVWVTVFCWFLAVYFLANAVREFDGQGTAPIPVREIVSFSWLMAGANLLYAAAYPGVFRLAITNVLGLAETGLFAFLQSVERLVSRNLPGTLLRGVVRPVMVAKAQAPGGMLAVEAGAWFLMKMNVAITLGGCIVVATAGDEMMMLLSGGKFPGAGLTLLMFLAVLTIAAQRSVIEMVLQITGQTKTLRTTAMLTPIGVVLAWYFARYGLNAAIGAIVVTAFTANALSVRAIRHGDKQIKFVWGDYVRIGVPAIAAAAAGYGLALAMNVYLAAAIALVIFTAGLAVAKPFQHRELSLLERGVGKKVARLMRRFSRETNLPAQEHAT